MIRRHLDRIFGRQRDAGCPCCWQPLAPNALPDDRSSATALGGSLAWGSRLAVVNSQPGASVEPNAPMPRGVGRGQSPFRP